MFRLPELTRYSLWYDELFSLTLAQQDWGDLLRRAALDRTNPPLFYALLKLWIGIGGESVAWMRLLPCLLGVLVAVPMVALARRVARGAAALPVAIAALAAGAASPLAVFLSNELRGYSLLLLLSAVSLVSFRRLVETDSREAAVANAADAPSPPGHARAERRRRAAEFAAVNVLLVYAHYFGWLAVAAEVAIAAACHRRSLRLVAACTAVAVVAFAPWATAVLATVRSAAAPLANVAWIGAPAAGDVPRFYDALVARVLTERTAWIGAALMVAPLAALAWRALRRLARRRARRPTPADPSAKATATVVAGRAPAWLPLTIGQLAWIVVFPVVVVYSASVAFSLQAFVPRYLIIVAPAWWLVVGTAMTASDDDARARRLRFAGAAAFAAFTFTAGAAREVRGGEKIPWSAVVSAIAKDAGPAGGSVYSLEGFTALPAAYYAATLGTGLTVRPVRDLAELAPPGWLLVRSGANTAPALGAGLVPPGLALEPLYRASVPSHTITVYRVLRGLLPLRPTLRVRQLRAPTCFLSSGTERLTDTHRPRAPGETPATAAR